VLAERLVRRLCPACRRSHQPDRAELGLLATGNGGGADTTCHRERLRGVRVTGYQGAPEFSSCLLIDDEARRLIHDRASEADLREHARRGGDEGPAEDGLRWVGAQARPASKKCLARVSRNESRMSRE